jgi:tetratricopeptide (TPR) repeat protein
VRFDDVVITGDLELDKLNDEELFAAGTSFYAAEDWAQAARYFSRICDFHPNSKHRRIALYNAGLSFEKLKAWDEAYAKFLELSDPAKGTGDTLDAAFRVAEVLYHMERFPDAVDVLRVLGDRTDLSVDKRIEARTQQGICELESNELDAAEKTLGQMAMRLRDAGAQILCMPCNTAHAQAAVAQVLQLLAAQRQGLARGVEHDEVVARAVHLGECNLHAVSLFPNAHSLPNTRSISARKSLAD